MTHKAEFIFEELEELLYDENTPDDMRNALEAFLGCVENYRQQKAHEIEERLDRIERALFASTDDWPTGQ